jgi:asparagine synthase (glutamine-hydrolysing)
MCGIIGGIGYEIVPDESLLQTIVHRGPDDQGMFYDTGIFLGHTRLSIQDLSENGHQPMISDDGNFVIVFNGEIYNHWEIRKDLESEFNFHSSCDTETILYSYIKYGIKFLNKLNGIFALAIFDKNKKELLIARDPFGVKPLYVYQDDTKLLFSSEIKSFLSFDIDKTISNKALTNYLTFLWTTDGLTPFEKVIKLEGGHYIKTLIHSFQNFIKQKYYQIPFNGKYSNKNENDLINELEEKLLNAVERQLLSDVPVGFFLSGGLDSSLLVALAKKLHPNDHFECFTIDVDVDNKIDGSVNDLDYAKLVADHLKVNLNIVKANIDILKDFDKMIWHLDEPQADAAPLNVINICKEAKNKGIKVLIGGTAGDDLFSGYSRHRALNIEQYLKYVPKNLCKITKYLVNLLPTTNPLFRRIQKIARDIDQSTIDRMFGYFNWISHDLVTELFNNEIENKLNNYCPGNYFKSLLNEIPQEKNLLNQMLYWELKTFLVDHNLNYTDKLSMAVGVETRVPYLDLELVEFSTKIPPKYKLKGNETKYILKKVAERYLPKNVIYRPKTGFSAPVRKWILYELDTFIQERLNSTQLNKLGIFNTEKICQLISNNKMGKIDASYTIWAILAIESWFRQFVSSSKTEIDC